MNARRPLSKHDQKRITELHAEGMSVRAIARAIDRSPSFVSKYTREMGLINDTTKTARATEVVKVDNASKRANLETRLLDEAGLLLDELHQPHLVYSFGGRDNVYEEHMHDRPDVAAKRALMAAAGIAIDKAVKLAEVDKGGRGAEAGKSLVGDLFAGIAAAVNGHDSDEQTEGGTE